MNVTYQKELFIGIWNELPEIWHTHCKEVTPDDMVNPDWKAYVRMEMAGALQILTARDDGKLVGYYIAIVQPHLHYVHRLSAYTDLWYVRPEYRKTGAGIKLVKKGEKMLTDLGVKRIVLSTPPNSEIDGIPPRLGYNPGENVWVKTFT